MNINSNQTTLSKGKKGEELAISFLKNKGFNIIKTNYRIRSGEIDVIATKNGTLHIVEVKTRSSNKFGAPYEFVTRDKQQKLYRTALRFIQKSNIKCNTACFDVISIVNNKLDFFENAFEITQ